MTLVRRLLVVFAGCPAILLSACAISGGVGGDGLNPSVATPVTADWGDDGAIRGQLTLGVRDVEYHEIDGIAHKSGGDIDSEKYRLRYRHGTREFGFYGGLAVGEYEDESELGGFEFGIDGIRNLVGNPEWEVATAAILDYDANVSFDYADHDVPEGTGSVNLKSEYFELRGRIGPGVDFGTIQLSAGVAASILSGTADVNNSGVISEVDFDGTSVGSYVRAAYGGGLGPFVFEIIGFGGDISGITINGGVQF